MHGSDWTPTRDSDHGWHDRQQSRVGAISANSTGGTSLLTGIGNARSRAIASDSPAFRGCPLRLRSGQVGPIVPKRVDLAPREVEATVVLRDFSLTQNQILPHGELLSQLVGTAAASSGRSVDRFRHRDRGTALQKTEFLVNISRFAILRRLRYSSCVALAALAWTAVFDSLGCASGSSTPATEPTCALTSECATGLVCALGKCRPDSRMSWMGSLRIVPSVGFRTIALAAEVGS